MVAIVEENSALAAEVKAMKEDASKLKDRDINLELKDRFEEERNKYNSIITHLQQEVTVLQREKGLTIQPSSFDEALKTQITITEGLKEDAIK